MPESPAKDFPGRISEPTGYLQGVDKVDRVISRNVIVFERLSRCALQQKHLSNRMHHRYVLMHVLKTPGVVSIDGRSIPLQVGETLLVAPHQFHHYIDLDADRLRWLFVTFEIQQGAARLNELTYRVIHSSRGTERIWADLTWVWEQGNGGGSELILPRLDQLLTHLLVEAEVDRSSASRSGVPAGNEWIVRVESLIIESVRAGWTLQQVAERIGLSERQARTRFEQSMGISMRDYRSNYQYHRAISLMRGSSRTLSEVAELSGFHSQPVFTRFIRRMSGHSPRELRKMILGGDV